jgi:SAM-dependent methyltransferase
MQESRLDPKQVIAAKELYEIKVLTVELEKYDLRGKSVYEFNCGFGQNINMLANKFKINAACGADENRSMIEYAKAARCDEKVDFLYSVIEGYWFPDFYDFVFSSFSLTKVDKKQHEKVLKKFHYLLRRSGELLVLMRAQQDKNHPFYAVMRALGAIEKYELLIAQMAQKSEQMLSVENYQKILQEVGFTSVNVSVRDEPIKFKNIGEFQKYMDVALKWHYPMFAAMNDEQFNILSEVVCNKYCEVMKDRDSSFDPDQPFKHPYKLLVMKATKPA